MHIVRYGKEMLRADRAVTYLVCSEQNARNEASVMRSVEQRQVVVDLVVSYGDFAERSARAFRLGDVALSPRGRRRAVLWWSLNF